MAKAVTTNAQKLFNQLEILGPAISTKAGTSTKNAKTTVNSSVKKQSLNTIYSAINKKTGANQGTKVPSNIERVYRMYEAFASGRKPSEIHDYYNKTGQSAYTIENGRVVRNPAFTRDQDYYKYQAPYRDKEPDKYTQENWWGYGTKEKYLKGKKSPYYSQINYWEEGTPESDMWHKYHNYRDPNWERDEKMLANMSKEDADTWRQQHWTHDKLYENEAEFRKDQAKERRNAEQRYFGKRDWINNQTEEERQKWHEENYATHHNKRNVIDRMFGMIANNSAAQVAYAHVTGGDKSDAFIDSLKYMSPFTDDVSGRKYWSDVIQAYNERLPENARTTESATPLAIGGFKHQTKEDIVNDKFSNAVMGLGMDVLTDPLTYTGGGIFSAGAKIAKGTGATGKELKYAEQLMKAGTDFAHSEGAKAVKASRIAKKNKAYKNVEDDFIAKQLEKNRITRFTQEDIERYRQTHLDELKNSPELAQMKRERVDNLANKIAEENRRAKEINVDILNYGNDGITFEKAKDIVLKSRPELVDHPNRLNELAYEFMQNYGREIKGLRGANEGKGFSVLGKEIVSAEKLRKAGDKTVAPLFNVANRKLRSTLGLAFSDKNKLLRYANQKGDKQTFSALYMSLLRDGVGMADKNVVADQVATKLYEFFENADEEQIMDFLIQHDKGTYKNLEKYVKNFDDIREKAVTKLKETNPDMYAELEARKSNADTLKNVVDGLYKEVSNEMSLKKYKNFSGVLDIRVKQLQRLTEAKNAGIEVGDLDDLVNQINYLKSNQELINKHYKDIYQIYGKPISALSDTETRAALGMMQDLEDIASMSGDEIPWSEIFGSYTRNTPESNSFVNRIRSAINRQQGKTELANHIPTDVNPDKMAEIVRKYRDNLIDAHLEELAASGYYEDLAKVPFNEAYMLSPEEHSLWKMLHYDEMISPVHYDIDNITQLLNHENYRSAYKNMERELADLEKREGQAVLDEMSSIMEEKYGLSSNQISEMFELADNQEYREMHELFARRMADIGLEEVRAGNLTQDQLNKLFNKYVPREISEEAKNYWENIFGEPFSKYVKEPGKFNPVQGEQMTYDTQRTFKYMEQGEKWWQDQIERKFVADIFKENRITKFTDEDVKRFIKTHDMSKYPELVEMKKTAGKLYKYNVAEIFMNRVVGHNQLMQSDAINNLVKSQLTTKFNGVKTSDKIVIPYIDMMEDCRRIAGVGDFADLGSGQQVFDRLVSSVGLDPRLVGKNISHFEVSANQLEEIQKQIKSGLVFKANRGKIPTMKTAGYNMDKTIYNMLNRYTKAQTEIMQSGLMNLYDTFLTKIKVLNTIINPGFHGQNAPSNAFQSFLGIGAEAFNTKRLKQAYNIIRTGDPHQKIVLNGREYTYAQMRKIFNEYGVVDNTFYNNFKFTKEADNLTESQLRDVSMEDFNNFFKNDFEGTLSFLNPIADIANKPFKGMGILGSSIEGTQRANLFLACVDQGYDFREAVNMVNKFLFDYGDLTRQEQQIFKRIIPFYSFLRKNVPMELEMMMEQPQKFVNTRRVFDTISRMSDDYIPPDERNEYRDTDIQLPFRINGEYYGLSDNMPYTQFEKWFDINKAVGQTSPLLKWIPEAITGEYAYTGMDIDSPLSYIMNQAPIGKVPDRLLHDKNFGSNPRDAKPGYEPDTYRRNMWLFGQLTGFPLNQMQRQEYNKNYPDFYEEWENEPGAMADLINIIKTRQLPENSLFKR